MPRVTPASPKPPSRSRPPWPNSAAAFSAAAGFLTSWQAAPSPSRRPPWLWPPWPPPWPHLSHARHTRVNDVCEQQTCLISAQLGVAIRGSIPVWRTGLGGARRLLLCRLLGGLGRRRLPLRLARLVGLGLGFDFGFGLGLGFGFGLGFGLGLGLGIGLGLGLGLGFGLARALFAALASSSALAPG